MSKRITKPKPRKGRVPMPPPGEVLRDRRSRRPADDLRRQLQHELDDIDDTLEDNGGRSR